MRARAWLALCLLAIAIGAWLWRRPSTAPTIVETSPRSAPLPTARHLVPPATKPRTAGRETTGEEASQYVVKRFPDCPTYFRSLLELRRAEPPPNRSLSEWLSEEEGLARVQMQLLPWIPDPASCADIPAPLRTVHGAFLQECAGAIAPGGATTHFKGLEYAHCELAYRRYLAAILVDSAGSKEASQVQDPVVLSAMLELAQSPVEGEYLDHRLFCQAAEQLFRIRPDNAEAARAVIIAAVGFAFNEEMGDADRRWKMAQSAVERLRRLAPRDLYLEELGIIVESRGLAANLIKPVLDRYLKAGSRSGAAYALLAAWEAERGMSFEAGRHLEEARRLAPHRSIYQGSPETVGNYFPLSNLPGLDHGALER